MTCCNVWGTTRLNFGTTSIQHFLADLFLIHSDIDIANFVDDNTVYLSARKPKVPGSSPVASYVQR